MGYSDLGCYGGEIRTPNLDRLAGEGLRFTQFYNNAKCIPTRATLYTGLYPRGMRARLTTNMVTVAEVLRDAGYQTARSGKWHLGAVAPTRPIDRGFDEFYGLTDGCCNYFDPAQRDPPFEGARIRVFAHNDKRITKFPEDFYTTDAFTDHAITTLRRVAAANKPFFLNLCYPAPHSPIQARPDDIARYEGKYGAGWEALRQRRHKRQLELKQHDPQSRELRDPEGGRDNAVVRQSGILAMESLQDIKGLVLVQAAADEEEGSIREQDPQESREAGRLRVLRLVLYSREHTRRPVSGVAMDLDQRMFVAMHCADRAVRLGAGDHAVEGLLGGMKRRFENVIEVCRDDGPRTQQRQQTHGFSERLLRADVAAELMRDHRLKPVLALALQDRHSSKEVMNPIVAAANYAPSIAENKSPAVTNVSIVLIHYN